MKTFRRFSVVTILYGWMSHSFSVFGIPFIDILEPAQITSKTFLNLYIKLSNFPLLIKELNNIAYNASVYNFTSLAGVALFISYLVGNVNDYYGIRIFANPANNMIFWIGIIFTFTSSFVVSTVVNEDVKREGFSL